MKSIFVKIFLWFWAATALVVCVFFGLGLWLNSSNSPMNAVSAQYLTVYGRGALDARETHGTDGLRDFVRRNGDGPTTFFILDGSDRDLSGHVPSAEVIDLGRRARANSQTEIDRGWGWFRIATPIMGSRGDRYIVLGDTVAGGPFDGFAPPTLVAWLMAVLITAGLVCYALSSYLAAPVRRLRAATSELAQGHLHARVGLAVGKRRDEIGDLGRAFDQMAERLEALVTAQQRLLRDISHELRSPLARLMIAADVVRQQSNQPSQAIDQFDRDLNRLSQLVSHLLTFTRIESGLEGHARIQFSLDSLLREVVADAEFEAEARDRRVRIGICEPIEVAGSPELIRRAIENVVRNAIYYTDVKTEVVIDLKRVDEGRDCELRVRDRGPGVPIVNLTKIFEPFYRLAEARERQTGGVGLGLAIAKQAILLHDGDIRAENAPNGGLIVTLRLRSC